MTDPETRVDIRNSSDAIDERLSPVWGLISSSSGIIWDFDGVVADTEPVQGDAYRQLLLARGKSPSRAFFNPYVGRTEPEIWEGLAHDFALEESLDALKEERAAVYLENAKSRLIPAWFVIPVLSRADARGLPNVIVSSGNHSAISALLDSWGLERQFSDVLALGSPSSAGLPSKNNRVKHAVARYGPVPLVIEDNAAYLAEARALGALTLGIRHSLNDLNTSDADVVLPIHL